MPDAEVVDVVVRYQDRVEAVRQRVRAYVGAAWRGLGTWHEADIDRFVKLVVPGVAGGQVAMAALTDAYLAALQSVVLGGPERPVGVPADVVSTASMRGVPAEVVWRRPGQEVWRGLADGAALATAVDIGLSRAMLLVDTDLQLARTHAARHVLSASGTVIGYRRVTNGGACTLCAHAKVRYGKRELMPIHSGCFCGTVPVYRTADPGAVRAGDGPTDDRGAPVVHQHGEIGPVLAARGDDFSALG